MTKISENDIELSAIEKLEALGYQYIYAPNIAPDGETPERESYGQVLLLNRMQQAIAKINQPISVEVQAEAIKEIQRIAYLL